MVKLCVQNEVPGFRIRRNYAYKMRYHSLGYGVIMHTKFRSTVLNTNCNILKGRLKALKTYFGGLMGSAKRRRRFLGQCFPLLILAETVSLKLALQTKLSNEALERSSEPVVQTKLSNSAIHCLCAK